MTEAVLDIKQWGSNLGVRLPAAIAKAAHLHADQRVRVAVKNGQVVIVALKDAPLSLEQRLASFSNSRSTAAVKLSVALSAILAKFNLGLSVIIGKEDLGLLLSKIAGSAATPMENEEQSRLLADCVYA